MKKLTLLLLVTLACSLGSTAFAAKEVFERTKPHVNVGTLGEVDFPSLTLALALAVGNPLDQVIDARTGTVTATVESAACNYEITADNNEGSTPAQAKDAYFVRCDRSTMSSARTREDILLARQAAVPVVVFLDIDDFSNLREVESCARRIQEMLSEAGYDPSNSGMVAGSIRSALANEKEGLLALIELMDTLDRCAGY
jgi:elongation factor Tu